jgi:comEA protein
MPLRRRPDEPSPRALAILASARAAAGDAEVPPTLRDEQVFLPQRDWIAAGWVGETPRRPGRHRRRMPPGPGLLTLPAALRGARTSGPRAAVGGLLAVALLAAAVFGVRVAWARAEAVPEPVGADPSRASSALPARTTVPRGFATAPGKDGHGATGAAGAASGAATGGGAGTGLVVHVVGQVRTPGVVALPAGARVRDAVERAGGALPGADLSAVNLARPLVDGEQLRVPRPGEAVTAPGAPGAAAPSWGTPAGPGGAGGAGAGPVNLNTATQQVLEELPGVGPVLAERIIAWRDEHGGFTSVDELAEVSGIGEKMFAQLQGKVTV